MNDNFSGKIYYTFGNADYDELKNLWIESKGHPMSNDRNSRKTSDVQKYKNTFLYKDFGEAIVEGKVIAFVHYPNIAKSLARTGKYDFVFYGHTHKPWIVNLPLPEGKWPKAEGEGVTLLNPGTTGGEIYPPTFALWDTKKKTEPFQLIRIHNLK